jgi:hypothetical protein
MTMRFHVKPRCVPPAIAARRLGLTPKAFNDKLPALRAAGFPNPEPVTGNYDLEAIDRYLERGNAELFASDDLSEAITSEAVILERFRKAAEH